MIYDVGTWRATLSPFVILTTEGRKDLGSIAQPEVDVTEILHFVQDDIRKRDVAFIKLKIEN